MVASDPVVIGTDNGNDITITALATFYQDGDADGYGDNSKPAQACSAPQGYVTDNTDCDDSKASVHFGATEVCNGIDDNWIGTGFGLSNFNPSSGKFQNYFKSDGLINNEYNRYSGCKMPDGTVFMGGMNGIDFFHPDSLLINESKPVIQITVLNYSIKVFIPVLFLLSGTIRILSLLNLQLWILPTRLQTSLLTSWKELTRIG